MVIEGVAELITDREEHYLSFGECYALFLLFAVNSLLFLHKVYCLEL